MSRTFGIRQVLACLVTVVLFVALFNGGGCGGSQHQLSGLELQELKRQEIKDSGDSLTAEQQYQIRTIQARTKGDFERAVAEIKAAK
jgi:hypothetical protein